jgi:hypothetical protein
VVPLPSGPQRPLVDTLVGTGGAGVGVGVGIGDGLGVGVGVGVGLVEEEVPTDEELGTGTGTDEEGGGETPLHVPKALRQPVPQYAGELPQKYHSEQQLPKPEPPQVVTFPHWPFGEMINVPEGSGGRTDELDGTNVELEGGTTTELDEGEGEGEGIGVGVGVGVGSGAASPQRPYCGWHPTSTEQCLL